MAALDIRPHSRRLSALAVGGVAAISVGAFAWGLARGVQPPGPSPFPPPQVRFPADPAGPKVALAVAERPPPHHAPPDLTELVPDAPPPNAPAAAAADPAADVAANAPAQPDPPADPAPPADDPPHL